MISGDPRDPALIAWLRTVEPRQELCIRYAMRGRFMACRADRAFAARIDELFALLNPNEDEYAAILRDARAIGAAIVKEIGEPEVPKKRRQR
jgi:hypothetical protein